MLEHALDLAELGFAVFPVGPDCRIPRTPAREGRTGGVWLASREPEAVRAMNWNGSNVAVATGAASGVFVLDIDVKGADGFHSASQLGLEPAWRSRTPSGGEHWWFAQPPRRALRNRVGFRPGLDIRTTGGSVAAPPSRKPSGPYVWIDPPWARPIGPAPFSLLEIIDPPGPPMRPLPKHGGERYALAALENEAFRLAGIKSGRNHALFVAAAGLSRFVNAGKLSREHVERALENAAVSNGLTRDDGPRQVAATIASGLQRGGEIRSDVSSSMRRLIQQRENGACG